MYKLKRSEVEYFRREFKSRTDLKKREPKLHAKLQWRGLLNVIFGESKKKPHGYWDIKENVVTAAKECKGRREFGKKYPGAYQSAKYNDWWDEVTAHMRKLRKHTKDSLLKSAAPYKQPGHWKKADQTAYYAAKKKGIFEECTKHMTVTNSFTKLYAKKPESVEFMFSDFEYKGVKNKYWFKHNECGKKFEATPDNLFRSWKRLSSGCPFCKSKSVGEKIRVHSFLDMDTAYSKCNSVKEIKKKYYKIYISAVAAGKHSELCRKYNFKHHCQLEIDKLLPKWIEKAKNCKSRENFKKEHYSDYKKIYYHKLQCVVFAELAGRNKPKKGSL